VLAGQLALTVAALFTGAAVYISVAEHPARLQLDDRAALAEWHPAYERGARMQATLAMVGALLGVLAWQRADDWRWLIGGVLLAANWPYTLLCVVPVNRMLSAIDPAKGGPESRALLRQWGKRHAGRTLLGCGAALVMLWASLN
jgi:anthrone oxygenase-like protein